MMAHVTCIVFLHNVLLSKASGTSVFYVAYELKRVSVQCSSHTQIWLW